MDNIWVHQHQSQKLIGGPGDPIISKEGSVFTPSQPPEAPPWVWLSANGQKTSHLMLDQPQLWFQDVWGHFCIGRNQTEDHLMPSLISWLRTLRRKYGGVWIRSEVARMESGWCQREKPVKTGCNGDPSISIHQVTTGDIDPNTLEIMFYHFFTSNSSIVWLFVEFESILGNWVDLRLHWNFWPPTYLLKIPARNRLTYVFKGQTDFWKC